MKPNKHNQANAKCPACEGWYTTTSRPNLIQHIKNLGKAEALKKYILGNGDTPHADWLKENVKLEITELHSFTFSKDKRKFSITL